MKVLFLLFFSVTLSNYASSQTETERPNTYIQIMAEQVHAYKDMKNSAFSFYVKDMNTGTILGDINGEMSIPSASTMKLVTTASALQMLGSGYRFETKIMHSGTVDSAGTLNGDIYIIGGGDPTLGSKYFNKDGHERDFLYAWVDSIYAYGIRKVNGKVIADGSLYSYQGAPSGWVWGDMGNYYGAGPAGLTIFDNLCVFHFETGENAGDSTILSCVTPHVPGIVVRNYVESADSNSDNAYVFGAPWSNEWFVRGSIPKNREDFEVKASMPDPELIAAIELDYALDQKGIHVKFAPVTMRQLTQHSPYKTPELKEIYTDKSPYLSSIINITNKSSINLFAEHILCQISVNQSGYGSTHNGSLICEKYWAGKIGAGGLFMDDGSGLSRGNSVSAKFLVDMLTYMHGQNNGDNLKESMALAGKSGTMSGMCRGTSAEGRVYGKSGTMTRVKSYAGYVDTKNGKKLAYAMISNNHSCSSTQVRKYFEQIMVKMANF